MSIVLYCLFGLLVIYFSVLLWHAVGFIQTAMFIPSQDNNECESVSIIICARNEEKKIGKCLKSILSQEYNPNQIQLILVNDASSDSTVAQAEAFLKNSPFQYKIISNREQKGKKRSITYAMQFVTNQLVIIRDADTFTRSVYWLKTFSDFFRKEKPDYIIGPLAIASNFGIFWALQAIETNVLAVFTGGSSFFGKSYLSNGANVGFKKEMFEKTNGFESHMHLASGDDVLFLEDIKKDVNHKVSYLKSREAVVDTYPCFGFKELLKQKTRWASKFSVNPNALNYGMALLVFMVNAAWLFCLFYGFLIPQNEGLSLIFVLLKLLIDNLLLFLASRFFKNQKLLLYALPVGCIYPVYAVIVSITSLFIKPNWK